MKKLMITMAALLVAAMAYADMHSQNMVGYNTITVPAGVEGEWFIMGNGLRDVGGTVNAIDIQDFISDVANVGFKAANGAAAADQLWVWLDGSYKSFYLYNIAAGPLTSRNGKWVNSGDMSDWDGGVANLPSTYKIPAGAAVWLVRKDTTNPITFTTAGEVVADATATHTIVEGFNFIGSHYAADWDINNLGIDWLNIEGTSAANGAAAADQLWVWLDGSYKSFYLYNIAAGPLTSRNGKWVNSGDMSAWGGGVANLPTTYKVPYGAATWYVAKEGGFTFTETRPFAID